MPAITCLTSRTSAIGYRRRRSGRGKWSDGLTQLLASRKEERGRVTIEDYYAGIEIDAEIRVLFAAMPDDEERLTHSKMVTFRSDPGVNAFRTAIDASISRQLSTTLDQAFGAPPVRIPTMGGTVPIVEAVNVLDIPAVIVPMVNMDNNQHNPNENIRIGNLWDGIRMCLAILRM